MDRCENPTFKTSGGIWGSAEIMNPDSLHIYLIIWSFISQRDRLNAFIRLNIHFCRFSCEWTVKYEKELQKYYNEDMSCL